MSKVTFIVATGHNMNIDAMIIPEGMIPIHHNFEYNQPPISMARLFKEDGVIKAETEIPDLWLSAFPYIGIGDVPDDDGQAKYVTSGKVYDLSLGYGPNQDPAIRPICDQIKPQVTGGQS